MNGKADQDLGLSFFSRDCANLCLIKRERSQALRMAVWIQSVLLDSSTLCSTPFECVNCHNWVK